MSEGIWIAVIGSAGVVLAALIAGVFSLIKCSRENKPNQRAKIKQSIKGNHNTQIGIQNVTKSTEDHAK